MLSIWWLLFSAIPSRCASPCDNEPLVLPIKDVQVLPDIDGSFMKGIPAKVGNPPQNIVLMPWAELNNTWIYDGEAYCDKSIIWNDRICKIRRGNLFDEDESKTFDKADDIEAAGGARSESTFQGSEIGIKKLITTSVSSTDTLILGDSDPLENFPIGIPRLRWDHGYTMLHALGLGSNSTYLNALRSAGTIGSRVWSIFWGRMWIDESLDGAMVLGGYDQEKVIGKNYTLPLDFADFTSSGGCWTGMKVVISDIKVNFRDGSDESIFPSNTALPVCLVPQRQLLLEAPNWLVDNFEKITRINSTDISYGLHWSARLFDAKKAFDGDITFYFNSGLEIRVPNSQYIVPFVDIDRNGSRIIKEETRELLINGVGPQPATLGRYFFTSAYLMVNHDAGTFTLWQANPTSKSRLVRVFDEETANQCDEASGIVQPSASPSSTLDTDPEADLGDADTSSGPSGGVIGGAVVGAVAGLAIIGFAAFYFIRRKRRRTLQAGVALSPVNGPETPDNKGWYAPPQEMSGSVPMPAEMQGQSHYVYEMDGNVYTHNRI